jgi:hypothetical protein
VTEVDQLAKYDPLFRYLCTIGDEPVELTFDEIERLVGPLPQSATQHREWWSNEHGDTRHVPAKAWLNAGRQVDSVDRAGRRVRFTAARWRRSS